MWQKNIDCLVWLFYYVDCFIMWKKYSFFIIIMPCIIFMPWINLFVFKWSLYNFYTSHYATMVIKTQKYYVFTAVAIWASYFWSSSFNRHKNEEAVSARVNDLFCGICQRLSLNECRKDQVMFYALYTPIL